MLGGETITRQRATATVNVYSGQSDALNWSSPSTLTVSGVLVAPAGTTEPLEVGRSEVDTDLTLYLPHGADVRPLDRVVVRGVTYDVQGERGDWTGATGWAAGSVVTVRKVAG
jgi:hypothetical protein